MSNWFLEWSESQLSLHFYTCFVPAGCQQLHGWFLGHVYFCQPHFCARSCMSQYFRGFVKIPVTRSHYNMCIVHVFQCILGQITEDLIYLSSDKNINTCLIELWSMVFVQLIIICFPSVLFDIMLQDKLSINKVLDISTKNGHERESFIDLTIKLW